jgi:curved DNA-binding protein CbpA
MNGQLSERPLAELIHEISAKSLAGRLQLQHDRVKAVLYFDHGELLYAASNLRSLRLREYLLKAGVAEGTLARYDERRSDLELVKALCADHLLSPARAEQIQAKQVTDVVHIALSWFDGEWDFDPRARIDGAPISKLDTRSLLLEAGRRVPAKIAAARFGNSGEVISPNSTELISPQSEALASDLLPAEVFLLSRLDRPTPLQELLAVSGVAESEALVHLYSLALAGFVQREDWNFVLGGPAAEHATAPAQPEPTPPPVVPVEEKVDEIADAQRFLEQLGKAQTHYDVLDVSRESTSEQMKLKYYDLARRYHPDRFRRAEATLVRRLESAFARVTQAYDTLRDDRLRANYNAKLEARQKAQQLAESAPKPTAPDPAQPTATTDSSPEAQVVLAERAEQHFKEGYAALQSGQKKVALGLFGSAANAFPKEARYRAFYGRLLAEQEQTRRAAEAELQAAVKLDPTNGEYRVLLAELYRDLGFMLRARGEAERAIAADPNNSKARELLRTLKSV